MRFSAPNFDGSVKITLGNEQDYAVGLRFNNIYVGSFCPESGELLVYSTSKRDKQLLKMLGVAFDDNYIKVTKFEC